MYTIAHYILLSIFSNKNVFTVIYLAINKLLLFFINSYYSDEAQHVFIAILKSLELFTRGFIIILSIAPNNYHSVITNF